MTMETPDKDVCRIQIDNGTEKLPLPRRAALGVVIAPYRRGEPEVDLTAASRGDLPALIVRQHATVAELERRIGELEARSAWGIRPRGMPGNKMTPKGKRRGDAGAKRPGKARRQGSGRTRM